MGRRWFVHCRGLETVHQCITNEIWWGLHVKFVNRFLQVNRMPYSNFTLVYIHNLPTFSVEPKDLHFHKSKAEIYLLSICVLSYFIPNLNKRLKNQDVSNLDKTFAQEGPFSVDSSLAEAISSFNLKIQSGSNAKYVEMLWMAFF